jgi:hypothetical protein
MSESGGPLTPSGAGRFALHLGSNERDMIVSVVGDMRRLLTTESAASDPAVGRLFPAAHPDDIFQNLEFERTHADPMLADRLAALDTVERTARQDEVTEPELLDWVRTINAIRLVLGTRLAITEDTTEADFAEDETMAGTYNVYVYLSWLEYRAVEVLSAELGGPG